jgi:hypothetical protein
MSHGCDFAGVTAPGTVTLEASHVTELESP